MTQIWVECLIKWTNQPKIYSNNQKLETIITNFILYWFDKIFISRYYEVVVWGSTVWQEKLFNFHHLNIDSKFMKLIECAKKMFFWQWKLTILDKLSKKSLNPVSYFSTSKHSPCKDCVKVYFQITKYGNCVMNPIRIKLCTVAL